MTGKADASARAFALARADRRIGSLRRAIAALSISAGVAVAAMPDACADPAAPSDGDVAAANAEVDRDQGALNDAVSQLASANNEIDRLGAQVEAKQQAANRAVEDLRSAQSAEDETKRLADAAQDELRGAQAQAQSAQRQAEALLSLMYANGPALSPELSLISAPSVADGLDRAATVQMLAQDQRRILDEARTARNDEANRAAEAAAADRVARQASTSAENARQQAEQAVEEAKAASASEQAKRDALAQARDEAQRALDQSKEAARASQSAVEAQARDKAQRAQEQEAAQPQTESAQTESAQVEAEAPAPPVPGPAAAPSVEQQLAQQVAAQDPEFSHLILFGATPAAATAPPPSGGGYVPRLYGPQAVETVVRRGLTQIGHIYSWGGGSAYGPTKGIHDGGVADRYGDYMISGYDCSGLMIYAFAGAGILLPHYTGYQYKSGKHVPASQMRRGDLIFYGPNASQHVALYLGNGWMLESPQSGERVKVSRVRTGGMTPDVVRFF